MWEADALCKSIGKKKGNNICVYIFCSYLQLNPANKKSKMDPTWSKAVKHYPGLFPMLVLLTKDASNI